MEKAKELALQYVVSIGPRDGHGHPTLSKEEAELYIAGFASALGMTTDRMEARLAAYFQVEQEHIVAEEMQAFNHS